MRIHSSCVPCLTNQVRRVAELVTNDDELRLEILRAGFGAIEETDFERPPPYVSQQIYRRARQLSGVADPFCDFKRHFNRVGLEMYPELKRIVGKSGNPFRTACLISLAGNIIDFAPDHEIRLLHTIRDFLEKPPAIDFVPQLEAALGRARRVLFIADNAGETVLDRLLIETAPGNAEFFYATRGEPVLNDATVEDAVTSGIDCVATVFSTGSDAPGIIKDDCSNAFLKIYELVDVVIAKGMGNFETLCNERDREIFFILIAKCDLIARHVGCAVGDGIVVRKAENDVLLAPVGGAALNIKRLFYGLDTEGSKSCTTR